MQVTLFHWLTVGGTLQNVVIYYHLYSKSRQWVWRASFSCGCGQEISWLLYEKLALCSFKCCAEGYFDIYSISNNTLCCLGRSHASKSDLQWEQRVYNILLFNPVHRRFVNGTLSKQTKHWVSWALGSSINFHGSYSLKRKFSNKVFLMYRFIK